MKIVHAADLHLDSPLRGLAKYDGAPLDRLRGATRRAFERLIELCLEERASLLLIAGDLFDGDWRDYSTGLFFAAQLARLRAGGVRVVLVAGNHDAQSQITRELRYADHVRTLATRKPESIVLEDLGVAVHGQGFATRDVRDDLASQYPAALPSLLNVGLLHTALGGRPGHAPYAPTTLEVLTSKGYDYWALGHVHTREVVSLQPLAIFPGNLQGRHAKETGAKGATVLTIENGRVAEHRHEVLDTVRWAQCAIDASSAQNGDDVIELARKQLAQAAQAADGRLLAARLLLTGASRAHIELVRNPERWIAQLRTMAFDLGDGEVWLEEILFETRAQHDAGAAIQREDALGQLIAQLETLAADPSVLAPIAAGFTDLRKRLPAALLDEHAQAQPEGEPGLFATLTGQADDAELPDHERALRIDDPAFLAALLPEVRELLLARLSEGEGT